MSHVRIIIGLFIYFVYIEVPAVKEIKAAPSNKGATGVTAATTKIAKAGVTTQNGTQPTNRNNPEKTPREGRYACIFYFASYMLYP